jgi:glycosyltransferase involved in cell wall biosynthesis
VRVLFLTPSLRPLGARRSLVELVRALPPSISPLVVTPGDQGIYLELKELGVPVAIAPHGAWRKLTGRFTALLRQLPKLWDIVGNFQPDVVHANEFHIVPQASFGSREKVPLCGHVRLTITPRQIETYGLKRCQRIVAVSGAVRSLFENSPLLDRIRVVHNGVDTAAISPHGPTHPAVPANFAARPTSPTSLTVGLLGLVSERKNQLVAAEAVALAAARGADVRLLLAGDSFKDSTDYGERLRERLAADDLRDRAVWLPFQKDAAALYRSMDINLLISGEEGFGRTIIEAGAAGRPSIGARIGGIPEIIEEGRTGWLVNAGDAGTLADLLVSLAGRRAELAAAGEAARGRVHDHFTIQAHVAAMIAVWQECIDAHR